jgi:hypothetical protein
LYYLASARAAAGLEDVGAFPGLLTDSLGVSQEVLMRETGGDESKYFSLGQRDLTSHLDFGGAAG